MAQGIQANEPDPNIVYKDIINLPHNRSKTHPHMSLYNRAAQFAPFAALSGYDDMVNEKARITQAKVQLTESVTDLISMKLNLISEAIKSNHHPVISITYFVPDEKKAGGKYVTVEEQIKKIDSVNKKVILMKAASHSQMNSSIDIEAITAIHGELVDYLDDIID